MVPLFAGLLPQDRVQVVPPVSDATLTNANKEVCHLPEKESLHTADKPAEVHMRDSKHSLMVLEDGSVELSLEAHDDFGVREMGIEWTLHTASPVKNRKEVRKLTTFRKILAQGGKDCKTLRSTFVFSPQLQEILPQEIVVKMFASDYCPENPETKSRPLVIKVMNRAEHAQTIRSLLVRLAGEVHDVAKKTDGFKETASVLALQTSGSLGSETCRKKILELLDSLNESIVKIDTLSAFARRLFLSGAQNEEIDPDGMKLLLNAVALLSFDARQKAGHAGECFSRAGKEALSPRRRSQLAEGISSLAEAGTAMTSSIEQFERSGRAIASGSFLARLRKTEKKQKDIARLLAEEKKEATSLPAQERGADDALLDDFQTLLTLQQVILKEISWIEDDLDILKERRQEPVYTQIYEYMKGLGLRELIGENMEHISQYRIDEAIRQSEAISRALSDLLKSIDEKRKSFKRSRISSFAGENDADISDSTFELTLKLIRMTWKQDNIRLKTEDANRDEQRPPSLPGSLPAEQKSLLVEEQDELQADMLELMAEQGDARTIDVLEECRRMMARAVNLLESGKTGQDAAIAQKNIMSLLCRSTELFATPAQNVPGRDTSCMLDMIRRMPGILRTSPFTRETRKDSPVSPSESIPKDRPEESDGEGN